MKILANSLYLRAAVVIKYNNYVYCGQVSCPKTCMNGEITMNALKNFWLFQPVCTGLPAWKKTVFWLWNAVVMLLAGGCLGVLSLLYAYGNYTDQLFLSYFENDLIARLNIIPVVLLLLLVHALIGRPWISFLTTSAVVWGFSLGNYYMLRLRDDPLMFGDLRNLREGASIVMTENYNITPDGRIWFGLACIVLGVLFLRFFARGQLDWKLRISLLLAAGLQVPSLWAECTDFTNYKSRTVNEEHINKWAATHVYISKGFVYPFIHSTTAAKLQPPENYDEDAARDLLASYEDADIPEDKKVDLLVLQLEAFSDFSLFANADLGGIDLERAYSVYHQIEAESISGNMLNNVFSAGTVQTEQAVMTGYLNYWETRSRTNSYPWYFRSQGYTVEGSHPADSWFYNRKNTNRSLGIPTSYFLDNWYIKFYPNGAIAGEDKVMMPELYRLWAENRDTNGAPYYSFNVTYQGHGPYSTEPSWRRMEFTDGRYSYATTNIINDYLASLYDTQQHLKAMLDQFAAEDRPVVIVGYGDHKPWFGDGNSAYKELGINIDVSTDEGFYNYYGTRYFIWANDAAKAVLGNDFVGEGPDISPNYLMNLLFDLCGWEGSAFTQATGDIMETLPVITTNGRYMQNGVLTAQPDEKGRALVKQYQNLEYYYRTHFAN